MREIRDAHPELEPDDDVRDLVSREVTELSEIERTGEMRTLIRLLAARSGQLLVTSALAADARLYFQPSADFNGTISDAITFRAWDQTSGTNGGIDLRRRAESAGR